MMNKIDEVKVFLEEYALFFEEMVEAEKTKLNTLLSNDLKAIEENILTQQVNAKRIENMENRRLSMFNQLGYPQKSLREVIQLLGEDAYELSNYYHRLEKAISLIKHFNKKSLELIRFNLSLNETKENNYDMKGVR